jgi:hypothetical protein
MGYYIRAFCLSDKVPTIREILTWAASQGCKLEIASDFQNLDLDLIEWEQVGIVYKQGKLPFLCEINRDDGTDDCLMREEVEEFKEFLSEVKGLFNINKKKVLNQLERTRFIISNQIPTSDFDDEGYDANGIFLTYFVQHCGGMIQADGEGFYEGNKLIVKIIKPKLSKANCSPRAKTPRLGNLETRLKAGCTA